jgi:hypothetical protein
MSSQPWQSRLPESEIRTLRVEGKAGNPAARAAWRLGRCRQALVVAIGRASMDQYSRPDHGLAVEWLSRRDWTSAPGEQDVAWSMAMPQIELMVSARRTGGRCASMRRIVWPEPR